MPGGLAIPPAPSALPALMLLSHTAPGDRASSPSWPACHQSRFRRESCGLRPRSPAPAPSASTPSIIPPSLPDPDPPSASLPLPLLPRPPPSPPAPASSSPSSSSLSDGDGGGGGRKGMELRSGVRLDLGGRSSGTRGTRGTRGESVT